MTEQVDRPQPAENGSHRISIEARLRDLGERTRGARDRWSPRARRVRERARHAAPFGLGFLAAFLAIALYATLFPGPRPLSSADVDRSIATALASVTPRPAFSEQAYAVVRPALVRIETRNGGTDSNGSLGSGVVIDTAGDILTSLHVVAAASSIELTFADGSQSAAAITDREPDEDIAVLRAAAPPQGLEPATLGNPGSVRVGSEAYAVGNPFGLTGSMSAGVVSGLDRSFKLPDSQVVLHGLIQIDAAVNPGNSGGPLVDRDGRVLGIVTGLVNPTDGDFFVGIGFAVPIDVAGGAAGLPQY